VYTVGDPLALCVKVNVPLTIPTAVGVNVTSNTWLPPGIIVTGNVFGANVNCTSDDVMFDITKSNVSVLFTVACNVWIEPTETIPKSILVGVISKI
jgi:hypothetical protein